MLAGIPEERLHQADGIDRAGMVRINDQFHRLAVTDAERMLKVARIDKRQIVHADELTRRQTIPRLVSRPDFVALKPDVVRVHTLKRYAVNQRIGLVAVLERVQRQTVISTLRRQVELEIGLHLADGFFRCR